MMAAGVAAQNGHRVAVLEKMEKPLRKLRITGKGRCNLTNVKPQEEFLEKVRVNADFFLPAYTAFDNRRLVKFFEKKGVKLVTEQGGRVFPKSGLSWDIADAMNIWCKDLEVDIICHAKVEELLLIGSKIRGVTYRTKKGFMRRMEAPNVIIATGGASYPATGSTGDGYALAHSSGHDIEPVRPSLVPLESSLPDFSYLKGLFLRNIRAKLLVDGEAVAEEFGEMSCSERGLEGAVILRMSRMAVDALIDERKVDISIDLKPALDEETLRARIDREIEELDPEAPTVDLLRKLMPRELVGSIVRIIDSHQKRAVRLFDEKRCDALVAALKDFRFPVSDYRPFTEAIVTAGGVSAADIDPETMQSRKISGLYFAGEVMDIDADTGGYNLQIAFSTGHLAGQLKKSNG